MARLPAYRPVLGASAPAPSQFAGAAGLGQARQALSALSGRLGAMADRAQAQSEAERERDDARRGALDGAAAGFDPEFRRLEDNTAYARAFNARGAQVLLTRLETAVRGELDAAFLSNRANPEGFQSAAANLREGYLAGETLGDDGLRADFIAMFDRAALGYTREAARGQISQDQDEARAASLELVTLRLNAVERLAGTLGLDEAADTVLSDELSALQETLVAYGPASAFELNGARYDADPSRPGAYSVADIQGVLSEAATRTEAARVQGGFERAEGLAAQRAYRAQFLELHRQGGLEHLDQGARDALDAGMGRAIQASEVRLDAARRDLERDLERLVGDAEDAAKAGLASHIGFDVIARTARERLGGEAGEALAQRAQTGAALADFSAQFLGYSPAQMEDFIAAERSRISDGATPFEVSRVEVAQGILAEARVQSQRDPLAWAERAGLGTLPPVDFSTADALADSLARRRSTAEAVADRYGAPVRIFTRAEAVELGSVLQAGELDRLTLAGAIVGALGGADGSRALGELAEQDWELGHVGGLISVGATAAARDLNEAVRLRREARDQGGGAPSYLPPDALRQPRRREVLGEFSSYQPGEAQRFAQAADLIYEARARRNGWERTGLERREYERALHEAAGAVFEDGTMYGGFGVVAGVQAVAPSWLSNSRFDDVVRGVISGEFGSAPELYAADGSQVDRSRAHTLHLRSLGGDQYRVFLQDRGFVLTQDGAPYVLNLADWREPIATERPGWVR